MTDFLSRWSLTILLLGLAAPSAALDTPQPGEQPGEAFKILSDPTDFRTRFEVRNEYQSLYGGGSRNLIVPRFEYAYTPALAFRVDVPYVMVDPDRPGSGRESGIGDITARIQLRALRTSEFSLVVAAEVSHDTSQDPLLGTRRYIFQPLAYAAIGLPRHNSTLFPYVQQFWTFGGTSSVEINTTLLRTGLLTRFPQRTYTFVEPTVYVDWERGSRTGATFEAELGRFFTKKLGLYVRPGVGLWGKDLPPVYEWNLEVGLRYFF